MKYFAYLFFFTSLFFSCNISQNLGKKKFFTKQELRLLDAFLSKIESHVCKIDSGKSFKCYNSYFAKAFNRLASMKGVSLGLNSSDLINNLDKETFDLFFNFSEMHQRVEKKYVKRKYLNIKRGKFVNYVDEYCGKNNNIHLREVWERSQKFSEPGPRTYAYLYENVRTIDFENDVDRLIYSVLFVAMDYNTAIADEHTIIK